MKRIAVAFLFLSLAMTTFAQEDQPAASEQKELSPEARDRIKAARAAYITERLELTSSESEKFWPIYREFSEKRETIHKKMREARKTESNDKSLLDLYHKTRQEELDLEKSYSGRFLQVISSEKLLKLHNAERDFRRVMLKQVHRRGKMQGREGQGGRRKIQGTEGRN